jgi:hypothetical protein
VDKLRASAEIALRELRGDLRPVLRRDLAQARKALARFRAIGEPGAEKILLLTRSHPVLALDSNGLRVLLRSASAGRRRATPPATAPPSRRRWPISGSATTR